MDGYTNFSREDFESHIDTFYPLAVDCLGKENGSEVRLALQQLLRRIGECRFGMPPASSEREKGTPAATPTSPSAHGQGQGKGYFWSGGRRNSRVK